MIIRNDKGTQDNSEVFFTVALRFFIKVVLPCGNACA